jgi:hypothetical protein
LGAVSGSVTSNPNGFGDPGSVTLTLPTLIGATIVNATFAGRIPLQSGGSAPAVDANRLQGSLTGPGINNPSVTLTRQ